jgi:murein DD-endopeptidase MepM/ murein hydrolase activator NlpD
MKHPPFNGTYTPTTGWRYASGEFHGAFDYPLPLGTPVFAVNGGTILDCADGVANNRPGYNPGTGAPSNWILLGTQANNRPVTVYYQHLSPGLKVHKGQRVTSGQRLAKSGNTGNSSGPHLHIAAMHGHVLDRYAYMANGGVNDVIIFPPSDVWLPTAKQRLRLRLRNRIDRLADRRRRLTSRIRNARHRIERSKR